MVWLVSGINGGDETCKTSLAVGSGWYDGKSVAVVSTGGRCFYSHPGSDPKLLHRCQNHYRYIHHRSIVSHDSSKKGCLLQQGVNIIAFMRPVEASSGHVAAGDRIS